MENYEKIDIKSVNKYLLKDMYSMVRSIYRINAYGDFYLFTPVNNQKKIFMGEFGDMDSIRKNDYKYIYNHNTNELYRRIKN